MNELFVTCIPGLEDLLLKELESLGFKKVRKGSSGVYVSKSMDAVYKINYCSRIASRVLYPLIQFPCRDKDELYRFASRIQWGRYLKITQTFAIDANVIHHPNLRNSLFASLVVKDALCDQFRESCGERPSVERADPNVQINLFVEKGYATISLDTSGPPLYKRGWREKTTAAPLQESLAAAILMLAGYTGEETLCDPFCGSGTLLIEAAMMATHTPAGFYRDFWGFFNMPEFSSDQWTQVKAQEDAKRIPLVKGKIFGSDKDTIAVSASRAHVRKLGLYEQISVVVQEVHNLHCTKPANLVICNPPYGKRLDISAGTYKDLAEFLKSRCSTSVRGFVLAPSYEWIRLMQMHVIRKTALSNGGLDISLFEISSHSKE